MTLSAAPSGTAGPLALLLVLLVGVATVLLIRNMSARLRRLPPSFEDPQERNDEDETPSAPA
ncbi:MAG: hypothetical protein QOJ79_3585 [Actinomycetota bacterium]|jgi:hypothetical protein|nr:hypothetical protein [Actinomycetota bacterium]